MTDEERDTERFRLGNPGWEYLQANGLRYEDDPDADKRLRALMKAADCLWEELRAIRYMLETGTPVVWRNHGAAASGGSQGTETMTSGHG